MKSETIQYNLPDWTLPVLMNGDVTGLSDVEQKVVDTLELWAKRETEKRGASHSHWGNYEPNGFCTRNDMPNPAGELGGFCYLVDLVLMYK